jgi:uncharacterized membrane protein
MMDIARVTNRVALGTVVLLVYWIFIFICTSAFGFKVFRENTTQVFSLSIFGIMSVLVAAVALNVMHNLTAIAEKHKSEEDKQKNISTRARTIIFLVPFILILALLYVGDVATSKKK